MPAPKSGTRVTTSKQPAAKVSVKGVPASPGRALKGKTKVSKPVRSAHGPSLVQQAVDLLRQRILDAVDVDPFLGSEEQLIESLGVSRPTFRQAARLLEHEMLLKIKRGIGGGFFAQSPSPNAVSRMAALYLNTQGATLQQVATALSPAVEEAGALLAASGDSAARRRLADFVQAHAGFENSPDEHHRVRVALEFDAVVGDLCGNPAVSLMLNLLRDLVRDPRHGHFSLPPERARVHAVFHHQLVDAVQRRDADMARLLTRRHLATLVSWLPKSAVRVA